MNDLVNKNNIIEEDDSLDGSYKNGNTIKYATAGKKQQENNNPRGMNLDKHDKEIKQLGIDCNSTELDLSHNQPSDNSIGQVVYKKSQFQQNFTKIQKKSFDDISDSASSDGKHQLLIYQSSV